MSSVISTTLSKAISSLDGFHHLVYSISGTTHTIFLDNSAIAVNISGGNVFSNYQTISNLFFGIAGDLSYGFTGFLDDVKIFNRSLTATDVSVIYNNNVANAAFSPLSITGLNNWYDASDPNGNGTIPSNGATISTWVDKSTYANNMIAQIAGTYATNSLNGLGSISFNQSWYRTATANAPYPSDVYVVVKLNSIPTAAGHDVIGIGGKTSDSFNSLTMGEYTIGRWHNGSSGFIRTPNAVSGVTETSTSFLLMSWSISNNNFYIYRNGVRIMYTNSYTWTRPSDNELRIGTRFYLGSTANNKLQGSVAEVLFYNSQLITPNREKIEGYLAWKWGLQTSLPTNHPYYASAPTTIATISEDTSVILARYTTSIWLDTSVSGNFVLSGSNVTTWKDKTTNSFNLTNNGTITYNSSSPTSVLIPAGTYLRNSSFNMLTSLHTWIFVVSIPSASASSDCRIVGLVNAYAGGIDILIQNSALFIYNHLSSSDGIYYNMSLTSNTKYLISVSFNMSTSFDTALSNSIIRINGSTQSGSKKGSTSSFGLGGTSQALLIGSLSNGGGYYNSPTNFNIYEIIGINNQALNITDTKTIENYLNTKWNLGYTIA